MADHAPSGPAEPDSTKPLAPHPGVKQMPRWDLGELPKAPVFTGRNWAAMVGPGLLMGGAAIGGGEWLLGPAVTARYGGALMWLATLSILGQVIYNTEISRYTLYTGEPIFTGKFRIMPGPKFWLFVYLVLDFGAVFPYLAANAATPLAVVVLQGKLPQPETVAFDWWLMKGLGYLIFLLCLVPLIAGGKIYNSLKAIMTVKIVVVLGFLLVLALMYSSSRTWVEIFSGFVKFGTVPIQRDEDLNGNGTLDPGEDWDSDGHLDAMEKAIAPTIDSDGDGEADKWEDNNGDGVVNQLDEFEDDDGDGHQDGDNLDNVFISLIQGRGLPDMDLSLIALIAGLAAIAGSGGLSNTPVSNYTRDQGWGMGRHVGAIPSIIGGQDLQLSHVGMVFELNDESLSRWRRWYRHVLRDQMVIWLPACFVGIALPSMLSVEFLSRGTQADQWTAAAMTAEGVYDRVAEPPSDLWFSGWLHGAGWGNAFWFMTLFCGFLVLAPSMASSADGLIRRWVDVFWTASPRLRRLEPDKIKYVYFAVLVVYSIFGLTMLTFAKPTRLIEIATVIFNFALGFSCWHALVVNLVLLPRELRPGWFVRIALSLAGLFFLSLATVTTLKTLGLIG